MQKKRVSWRLDGLTSLQFGVARVWAAFAGVAQVSPLLRDLGGASPSPHPRRPLFSFRPCATVAQRRKGVFRRRRARRKPGWVSPPGSLNPTRGGMTVTYCRTGHSKRREGLDFQVRVCICTYNNVRLSPALKNTSIHCLEHCLPPFAKSAKSGAPLGWMVSAKTGRI